MRLRIYDPRILAIDLRASRFAYAVFEGSRMLVDYGMGSYPGGEVGRAVVAGRRLSELLTLFSPAAIVVKKERWDAVQISPSEPSIAAEVMREARSHSIPVRLLGEKELRATYQIFGSETKYEMAETLTRVFPELLWKLPPKRKSWQPEHPRMSMFDAIGLGVAYWQHETMEVLPDSELS